MSEDFTVTRFDEGFWRICDERGDAFYLIEGGDRAALIDCGVAGPPLESVIRELTDKPVSLFLTHGHIDHIYHCDEFTDVYLHNLDILDSAKLGVFNTIGAPIFGQKMKVFKMRRFRSLNDGEVIDLGGVSLRVVRFSGHTHGSVVFVCDKYKTVFNGDALGNGTGVWMFLPACTTISEYKNAAENAAKLLAPYENYTYCGGHIEMNPNIVPLEVSYRTVKDMTVLCDKILRKEIEPKVYGKQPFALLYFEDSTAAILTRRGKIK